MQEYKNYFQNNSYGADIEKNPTKQNKEMERKF
jgi:hypothetical protein